MKSTEPLMDLASIGGAEPVAAAPGTAPLLFEPPAAQGAPKSRRNPREILGDGLRAPSKLGKNFVLDTNVLLHDPECLHRFADNHVCIPVDVLTELDRFKGEQTDRGAGARTVHRLLSGIFDGHAPEAVTSGVPTRGGGTLRLVVFDPDTGQGVASMQRFQRVFPERDRIDHRILGCALMLRQANPGPVIVVTKDLNMQLKARALGIPCEDYQNTKVDPREVRSFDIATVDIDPADLQRFASSGGLPVPDRWRRRLAVNQYVLLSAGEKRTMPARVTADGFVRLLVPDALRNPRGVRLRPVNLGQQCLLDALLNPDITLVTCYGQAGTGKTLVAVAAGLHCTFEKRYSGVTVSRPVVPMGDTVGFLPGDLDEKMRPWLQPIYDALEFLTQAPADRRGRKGAAPPPGDFGGKTKAYEAMLESGLVEVEALCYIRGRSIPNRFFVLDEAQQLSPLEAKTVVTRMSKGSKLVLIGDPAQIDNPYVDSRSNGLVFTRTRLQGVPFAAHVVLNKGERSELAEAGARLM